MLIKIANIEVGYLSSCYRSLFISKIRFISYSIYFISSKGIGENYFNIPYTDHDNLFFIVHTYMELSGKGIVKSS